MALVSVTIDPDDLDATLDALEGAGVDLTALQTALTRRLDPSAWRSAGDGRWTRQDGWLLQVGDQMVELFRAYGLCVINVYGPSNEPPSTVTGGPLDGTQFTGSRDAPELADADDTAIWAALAAEVA